MTEEQLQDIKIRYPRNTDIALLAEIERLRLVEREALKQSQDVQDHWLSPPEAVGLRSEVERLRAENRQLTILRDGMLAAEGELKSEVEQLRSERKSLWRFVTPTEGTPVVYVGVHVIRWRSEWGEPAAGFIQAWQAEF